MLRALEQPTVWGFVLGREEAFADAANKLGPFPQPLTDDVSKHVYCPNYDGCLSFAAVNKWTSFSCIGCRRVQGRQFED